MCIHKLDSWQRFSGTINLNIALFITQSYRMASESYKLFFHKNIKQKAQHSHKTLGFFKF